MEIRSAWLEVDLNNLKYNVNQIKKYGRKKS